MDTTIDSKSNLQAAYKELERKAELIHAASHKAGFCAAEVCPFEERVAKEQVHEMIRALQAQQLPPQGQWAGAPTPPTAYPQQIMPNQVLGGSIGGTSALSGQTIGPQWVYDPYTQGVKKIS